MILLTRRGGLTKTMEGRNEIESLKIPAAIIALPFRDKPEMEQPLYLIFDISIGIIPRRRDCKAPRTSSGAVLINRWTSYSASIEKEREGRDAEYRVTILDGENLLLTCIWNVSSTCLGSR